MLRAPSLKSASPSLPDKGSRPPTDKMPNRPGAKRASARQAGVRSAVAMLVATPLEDSLESQRYVWNESEAHRPKRFTIAASL